MTARARFGGPRRATTRQQKVQTMKQTRPFRAVLSAQDKRNARELARMRGTAYGWFFDTSGKMRLEPVNPGAQYGYVWRTDQ